jgi:soluble lytic murein transglycosylase
MQPIRSQASRVFFLVAGVWAAAALRPCGAIAASMSGKDDAAVARLGQAISAYEKRDFFTTVHLLSAPGQSAKLRDYVVYYLANAELVTNQGDAAARALGSYAVSPVAGSPLAGRISLLYAKALLGQHNDEVANSAKARQILQNDYPLLPQPDGDFALAQAFEATGFPRQAAIYYQHVYYSFPAAESSEKARAALEKLRATLGTDYPAPAARQRLDRGAAWLKAKQFTKARQEYAMLVSELTGSDRDEAQSGVGAALYLDGDYAGAEHYLAPLQPEGAEAAAERLYYLTEAYRRLNNDSGMLDAVHQLGERYPASLWRLKALITAGNRFLLLQDRAQYVPLYQAAATSFPGDGAAALCEWRVVWAAWLENSPKRVPLLKEQVEKFPGDTHVSDALFFLGRSAEQESNFAAARAYYERLNVYFPHYYYAGLARTRLTDSKIASVKPDAAVRAWLEKTADAAHSSGIPADLLAAPNDATRQRIDRGRLLIAAGLTAQAVEELEFGAKQQAEQPTLLAMELSRAMPTPYLAVKVMKKFSGDYLSLPFEKASRSFWEMLFPMPFGETLTATAMERDLDPYAVAGLIRQESEFNPGARSAVAYGLMQLIPSTGRALGRREGVKVTSAGMLLNPGLNIRLGTQYLRGQLDHWEGDWVKTLAAYNAGPSRVREWLEQFGYGDSAEFIENIPFSETRDYVQAVLRNGQVYRELYGKERAVLASDVVDDSSVPVARLTNTAAVTRAVAKLPGPKKPETALATPKAKAAQKAQQRRRVSTSAAGTANQAAKAASAVSAKKSTTKPPAVTRKSTSGHSVAATTQKHASA